MRRTREGEKKRQKFDVTKRLSERISQRPFQSDSVLKKENSFTESRIKTVKISFVSFVSFLSLTNFKHRLRF